MLSLEAQWAWLIDLAPTVEFGLIGRIYLVVLLVGIPFVAVFQPIDRDQELPSRRDLYLSGILGILFLAGLAGLALYLEDIALAEIGLTRVELGRFAVWTAAVTLGALLGNYVITRTAHHLGVQESRLTFHLIPRTRADRLAFLGLSTSAGFGEELLYHGYLIAGLSAWLGSGWWAALIANTAFGILHSYQGQIGALRAGLMGAVLTLPVLFGAGLWASMAGHFLVNALLGMGLWKVMLSEEQRYVINDM